jgi:methanogenic corrinoid protein MtbC1
VLGLLMVEAVLAEQGAKTVNLGQHAPLDDIQKAVISCKADVLALSFSFSYPERHVKPVLKRFRRLLPAHMEIWAGGAGVAAIRRSPSGVRLFLDIPESVVALRDLIRQKRN